MRAYLTNRGDGWRSIDVQTGDTIHKGGRHECARIAAQKGYYFAY